MHPGKSANVFVKQATQPAEEKTASAQTGRDAAAKHQGGQTAMKSLMLPASVEIGPANCPNPERVLIPPNR